MSHNSYRSTGRRHWRKGVAAAAAVGVAVAGSAALAAPSPTVVFLASNKGPDITMAQCNAQGGCGPEVTAPIVLAAGQHYKIHVTGTISVWAFWVKHPCGQPEPAPEFPTAGRSTPTSDDVQFRFAIHLRPCRSLPFKMPLFQINLGSGWFHPTAVGNPTQPSGNHGPEQHPYNFIVVGEGVQPSFRFVDNHPSDNDGRFRIAIRPAP